MDAIRADNLIRRFGRLPAVDGLTFTVAEGQVFGLVGPDGAGKTTTMRLLASIMEPTSGDAWVAGHHVVDDAERIKEHIGYMSQRFGLYEDLTVEENIDFYSGIYRIPAAKKSSRKDWIIAMAGLAEHRHSRAATLSGGWKQRLALGCALLHEPPIIFLDEPTSGVDPVSRRRFWDLIYELAGEGVTVFVTTHYMDEAEYCDRLGLIYRGQMVAAGTPEQLKNERMPEDVLDLLCDRPQDAMGAIEKLPGVKGVALFGQGLHVVAADGDRVARTIRRRLPEAGYAIERIEAITPSLEDVFVSLIEARDRDGDEHWEIGS